MSKCSHKFITVLIVLLCFSLIVILLRPTSLFWVFSWYNNTLLQYYSQLYRTIEWIEVYKIVAVDTCEKKEDYPKKISYPTLCQTLRGFVNGSQRYLNRSYHVFRLCIMVTLNFHLADETSMVFRSPNIWR